MNDFARIATVIRYLDENHAGQPALADLAATVGLSESHFHRLFHRWAGVTPKDFLQSLTVEHAKRRAASVQNRIADRITDFAGSMTFVYLHLLWFGCWIGFGVEGYPYGLLTMIVSLEAIFLSTFVMIS